MASLSDIVPNAYTMYASSNLSVLRLMVTVERVDTSGYVIGGRGAGGSVNQCGDEIKIPRQRTRPNLIELLKHTK